MERERDMPVILVIDPEESVSDFINAGLRYDSLLAASASDGIEGIKLAQQLHPILIILEWRIPYSNGSDICRRLRNDSRTRNIPILAMSSNKHDREISLAAGADDYLARPFDFESLLRRIQALLPPEVVASLHLLPPRYNPLRRTRSSILDFLEEWTDQALQDKLKLSD